MVMTPSFMHLSMNFSNQKLAIAALPWICVGIVEYTSDSFYASRFFKMNIQLYCHLCCSSYDFLNSLSQCMTVSFCQCWFSPTVPLRRFLPMTHVTWETGILDTPTNVSVFATDDPAKSAAMIPFQNWTCLPFFDSFTKTVTEHNL
jgi:hypothetical protein